MNAEYQALFYAFEAYRENRSKRRRIVFESRVDDVADRTGVSKEIIIDMIRDRYPEWKRAQGTTTLPPTA